MKIGYARTSNQNKSLEIQLDQLNNYGVDEIVTDVIIGSKINKESLEILLKKLRKDDILIVCQLDRLGRTIHQLVNLINHFNENGINFVSINDGIDTRITTGLSLFSIMGSVATMEKEVISERVNIGIVSSKTRGRNGGRKKLNDTNKINVALSMIKDGYSKKEVSLATGIARTTLYRYIKESQKI